MAYTVLARRYRSGTFDEVIGQDHVAQTLKKAIESGRIAHAYLFCGTRGVGKTSMARILAKALNCQSADGPTANPCNKCESCTSISRGEAMDVIEIDAASNRGIDNIRDLISNAQYRPASARFKIYIIDEVHGLSKDAFNALLKVLEEPPSHVKFILATTEPEKVLPTILSRCQRYDFRNIGTREIAGHLKEICKQEKIKADDDALLLVAKAGAGSMRDALSLLDRMLSVGEKQLTVPMIEQLLGLPRSQLLLDLAAAIGAGDVKQTLSRADAMIVAGMSADTLLGALVDHLRNLLIIRTCGADCDLVEVPGLAKADLAAQAEQFDPVALSQDITLLEELRRQLRSSQAGRALLDAMLVRLALSDQFSSIGELLTRVDGGGAPSRAPARSAPVRSSPPAPAASNAAANPAAQKKNSEPSAELEPALQPEAEQPASVESFSPSFEDATPIAQQEAVSIAPATDSEPANVEPASLDDLPAVWQTILQIMATKGPGVSSLLAPAQLIAIEGDRAVIRYGSQHGTFVKLLDRNGKREQLSEAFSRVLNRSTGIRFEVDPEVSVELAPVAEAPAPRATPAAAPEADRPRAPAAPPPAKITPEIVETIRTQSPLIKALMDGLGATILKVE